MKSQKLVINAIIFFVILAMQSCIHIRITSEIHRDGSITKTISLEGSREEILESSTFGLIDSGWDTVWTEIDKDKTKLVASHTFSNDQQMNKLLNPEDTSSIQLRTESRLKKKFRWFFTYFDFTETLLPVNPFKRLDWKQYLSAEEVRLIGLEDDHKKADSLFNEEEYGKTEKKLEGFLIESIYTEIYEILLQSLSQSSAPDSLIELVEEHRTDIRTHLEESGDLETASEIIGQLVTYLEAEAILEWVELNSKDFQLFDRKMHFFNKLIEDDYSFAIRMPGLLMETNSATVEGSESQWEPNLFDFYFTGYPMKSETRVINKWAFVLSGIILLIALMSFVLLLKRVKK